MDNQDGEALIREYLRTRNPKIREQAIVQFLPIVRMVLGRMQLAVQNKTELEDIRSAGVLGLIHALDHFDAARNTKFTTYATHRVRGFILDYLRKIDAVSRTDRARLRDLEKQIAVLTRELGREPGDHEIAAAMGLELAEYHRLMGLVHLNFNITLEQTQDSNGEEVRLTDVLADESTDGPFEQYSKKEMLELVKSAIRRLPEKEKLILVMYYHDELTLLEIGKVLGLSESRVSRLLGRAVLRVRNHLREIMLPSEVPATTAG